MQGKRNPLFAVLFVLVWVASLAAPWAGAQTIGSISPTTTTRSGFLEIFGSGFTTTGEVFIDGRSAPVAT